MNIRRTTAIVLAILIAPQAIDAKTATYYYTDPQGSTLATTDAQGNVLSSTEFRPFGAPALGSSGDGPSYTGHVSDADSSMIYMQARYYDPDVARFISPDPLDLAAGSGFTFNRFSYVSNNPTSLVDPTGLFAEGMSADEINCEVYHCEQLGAGDTARAQKGIRASNLANSALQSAGVAGTGYGNVPSLLSAWSDVVVPIATRLQVEVGVDVLFRSGLGYLTSAAYSSGDRNQIDFSFLRYSNPAGKLGEIHTHPDNNGFSGMTAMGAPMRDDAIVAGTNGHGDLQRYFNQHTNGYVALPNGAIYGWNYASVKNRIDRSGAETLGDSVTTIRPAH